VSRVLAFTPYRGGTAHRLATLESTIKDGRDKAGHEFEWRVWDNAKVNKGQHTVFNEALAEATTRGFDFLLRIDDDVSFLSQRWMAKMLESADKLGPQFILSPTIIGLKHPPEMSQCVTVNGVDVRFLTQAIGGACRLHPVKLLTQAPTPYVSDVRLAMGMGDATGIVRWAEEMTLQGYPVACCWLEHVRVKHATATQERDDEQYHAIHSTLQRVPYLPSWPEAYNAS